MEAIEIEGGIGERTPLPKRGQRPQQHIFPKMEFDNNKICKSNWGYLVSQTSFFATFILEWIDLYHDSKALDGISFGLTLVGGATLVASEWEKREIYRYPGVNLESLPYCCNCLDFTFKTLGFFGSITCLLIDLAVNDENTAHQATAVALGFIGIELLSSCCSKSWILSHEPRLNVWQRA